MTRLSGGCQCGAVRFAVGKVIRASVCHCRMCQKAFGSAFGAFAVVDGVTWTRGAPKRFQSSNLVQRGFCADCGTPLTYEYVNDIGIAAGAFDTPDAIEMQHQLVPEMAVRWFHGIENLPLRSPEAQARSAEMQAKVVSHQHPDHDTATWPAEER